MRTDNIGDNGTGGYGRCLLTYEGELPKVAVVHDYLTQRGGAERVVLLMAEALEAAPIYTSLYEPNDTFPDFKSLDVRTSVLNKVNFLRRHHRFAVPVLATTFSRWRVDADVVLCSSSGWAHGIRTDGRKIVYCYAPARWLYQSDHYLSGRLLPRLSSSRADAFVSHLSQYMLRALTGLFATPLRKWDKRAAASVDVYLTSSTATAVAIRSAYGIEAEVVPPPPTLRPFGPEIDVDGIKPGYILCIARLLPYKNVAAVIDAVRLIPGARLVVVGEGPERVTLEGNAGPSVSFTGRVGDATLRWIYRNASALVAASHEDYGLTPLEAATFGHPSVVLRGGGFLDTVIEGKTGLFFDQPQAEPIAAALVQAMQTKWDPSVITAHADRYNVEAFQSRIRELVLGSSNARRSIESAP